MYLLKSSVVSSFTGFVFNSCSNCKNSFLYVLIVEGLYAFSFSCSTNFLSSSRFSLLSFHAVEATIGLLAFLSSDVINVALTSDLFFRYAFKAVVSRLVLLPNVPVIVPNDSLFRGRYQQPCVCDHFTPLIFLTSRLSSPSLEKIFLPVPLRDE
jgi:hypothetical protein